ncbi:hypothetical protein [Horticoccus sp. 23ND18S-11]|uniref:hypothetical protein n=1 Tax=Horticoccus sp. 23ND18S-11 TaxID=3391832 RepID=UPI0039C8E38A
MGKKTRQRAAAPLPPSAAFSAAEMSAMTAARDRASASTPAVVREALLGQAIKVGGVTLPVIMLGHVLLLQKIDSPLAIAGAGEPTNEQIAEALFVFNTPAKDVLHLLQKGREVFSEAVLEFCATKIPLAEMRAIGTALGAQMHAAQSTMIGGDRGNHSPASSGEGTGAARVEKKSAAETAPVTSRTTDRTPVPPAPLTG